MIIQMMGPQACGKGTQAELLSKALQLPIVSLGDLLRNIPKDFPQYTQVEKQMKAGELVDFEITANVIKHAISKPIYKHGYILDGWGRILEQYKFFDPLPDIVIFINIPREESLRRISGRRICESTGEVVNIYTLSPEEVSKCAGPLVQREDDTPDAINRRLDIFENDTMPVVKKYRTQGNLIEVSGLGTPEEVFGRILKALELFGK